MRLGDDRERQALIPERDPLLDLAAKALIPSRLPTKQSIGISRQLLRQAGAHIVALHQFLDAEVPARRASLYAEFREHLRKTGSWKLASVARMSDRSKVAKRRR